MKATTISPSIPGVLRVITKQPNAQDSIDQTLFLFKGDPTKTKITEIIFEPGVTLPGPADRLKESGFQLTVFHLNDLHGHLVRFTPGGEEPVISRMAWQILQKQKEVSSDPNKAVITLTAGDDCIGSIFDELLGSNEHDFQVHASYHAYSKLGVDAACLGNHDFDLGSDLLVRSIKKNANFPILAANISGCTELDEFRYPAAIVVKKGIRIGIIGLVTQAELKITNPDCKVTNPIHAVNNLLPAIRPYCDVMIILSHLGLTLTNSTIPMVTAGDVEVAQNIPFGGVHLIVGGHSHHELNPQGLSPKNIINGIPIVQTGSLGRFLGQVDIKVSLKNTAVTNVRLISTESLPVEQTYEKGCIQPMLMQARALFSRKIGIVSENDELSTDHVRNTFASKELPLANFITDAIIYQLKIANQPVDIAMIDSSSLRRGLSPGEYVTLGDWFNVMPFADTIRIFQLTGKQLYELLQDNASRFDRPNEPHTERGFLQFSSQIRYTIALGTSRSEAAATDIFINGVPIEEQYEKEFLLAGTSFIREYANSWEKTDSQKHECFLIDLSHHHFSDTDIFLRREMVSYIQNIGGVTDEAGALSDGRLKVVEKKPLVVTDFSIGQFVSHVSSQKHAMAGAVIAVSAAQAAALGQACTSISSFEHANKKTNQLGQIIQQLMGYANQDANAIAEFVALREAGEELKGKEFLCNLPAKVGQNAIEAAKILEEFRTSVNERVRDDLEMSISLLCGTAQAAILLLDSNLRIWTDEALLIKFEPILNELQIAIKQRNPVKGIRKK